MKISTFSVPKDRSLRIPSDDTLLVMPGVLAVFDGATSPQSGSAVNSSGRVASQAAARAVAGLAVDHNLMALPAADIFAAITRNIAADSQRHGMEGKPSTTMALAVLDEEQVRFVLVGDSTIRVNGEQTISSKKPIDDVSTANRLAVWPILAARTAQTDALEKLVRSVLFGGYQHAVATGVLTADQAQLLRDDLGRRFAGLVDRTSLDSFLDNGIKQQFRFANRTDHPMGYSTLNGDPTSLADIIDLRMPRSGIRSLEIWTDGYFLVPDAIGIDSWEAAYATVEAEDFHKLNRFANVKGATSTEFADDRSLIVAEMP